MNADGIRIGVTERLAEAQELLVVIRGAEQPLVPLPALAATLRGLFYVSCYGAIEFAVTQGTQTFITFVNSLNVKHGHLELAVNSISLHAKLASVENSRSISWSRRRELYAPLGDASICAMPDTLFGAFVQNVRPDTIKQIFESFGIDKPPTLEEREASYLLEIVERRNAVSHGRMTATEAGQNKTSQNLEEMFSAVNNMAAYFLSTLEEHTASRAFIREGYRAEY